MSFKDCRSLRQILIPSSVTELGKKVFDGCSSLKLATISSSLKNGVKNAFPKNVDFIFN
ncbi:hypothetical protein M9Y10_007542 [Tritrichomonas musculus]|uniref:Leucine-rich repeat domain-containing protein n=1 Tax=Tritrichomonas musculus TaxID=1915356 RepID=A0ABR2J2J0_9EUKA